MALRQKHIIL